MPERKCQSAAKRLVGIASKYCDGLPLYRQAALLSRFGGDLSRNTLAASVVRVGREVQPIINLLRDHLLDSPLIHGDETHVQVLKETGKTAQRGIRAIVGPKKAIWS